ncbi:MAG: SGNH/GDSL hydrolase family protein [Nanoarchaeota archaeon]|nr:SGNH/GDSL hydrolase family protein [Nanoarchaeota archaeon]
MKKNYKNLLLLTVTLILFYIGGELVTRMILYKDGNPFTIDYPSNLEGYRDYNHNLQKTNNTFRIEVLGDSFTYGLGVYKTEDTSPKVLEKVLNKNEEGIIYEVFNFGRPSHGTEDELNTLKDYGLKYKPDLVIINFNINDIEFEGYNDPNVIKRKVDEMRVSLRNKNGEFPHFYYFILKNLAEEWCRHAPPPQCGYLSHIKGLYKSENWGKEKNLLKEIKILGDKNNFKTVIVIFPLMIPHEHEPEELYNKIKNGLEQGLAVLNLYEYYQDYDFESIRANYWDYHPNEKGQEIAAKATYNYLIEKNLIPDAENRTILQI